MYYERTAKKSKFQKITLLEYTYVDTYFQNLFFSFIEYYGKIAIIKYS